MHRNGFFSHCRNESIRSTSLITTLIYPCHSAGGTVRAFTLAGYPRPGLLCPLLTPAYVMGSPLGLLTRLIRPLLRPPIRVPLGLAGGWDALPPDARDFVSPVSPIIRYLLATGSSETQRVSRGKLRLLSAHDRQIYVAWPYDG